MLTSLLTSAGHLILGDIIVDVTGSVDACEVETGSGLGSVAIGSSLSSEKHVDPQLLKRLNGVV